MDYCHDASAAGVLDCLMAYDRCRLPTMPSAAGTLPVTETFHSVTTSLLDVTTCSDLLKVLLEYLEVLWWNRWQVDWGSSLANEDDHCYYFS